MARSFDNLYIGGSWVPAGAAFDDLNPADGSVWARVADGNSGMAARAIQSAQDAFAHWSGLHYNERAHCMLKVADEFERRRDDLVSALQGEGGGWFELDALPDTLLEILVECGRMYAPFMLANAAAVSSGDDELDCMLDGETVRWQQNSFKYQAKCLGWLQQHQGTSPDI